MDGDAPKAREIRATNTRGMVAEMGETVPLEPPEMVISEGVVRLYRNPFSQRPCYVRLSSERLCLLEHFATRPDRITEIPPAALGSVTQQGQRVTIAWTGSTGADRTVALIPWSGRALTFKPLSHSPAELASRLEEWRRTKGA